MNLKTTPAAVTALLMAATGLAVTAAPAQAYAPCYYADFSPRSVVVGLTPVTANFEVQTTGCDQLAWSVEISDLYVFAYVIDGEGTPSETFDPSLLSNSSAGRHDVEIDMYSRDYDETSETLWDGFSLIRRTSFTSTFNASPEPVRKGQYVKVSGRLTQANWDTNSYTGYAGARAALQFRAKGSVSYQHVKSITTDSTGWAKTAVKATRDGTWRLKFYGNTTHGETTSNADFVDVR